MNINKIKVSILFVIVFFLLVGIKVNAQPSLCNNTDFSLQNFLNWNGCYCASNPYTSTPGNCYTAIQNPGTIPNCTPLIPYPTINCGNVGFLTNPYTDQPSLHTIINQAYISYPNGLYDSLTNGVLKKIPPGVDQVCRLNAWQIYYQTSQMSYQMLVDTNVSGLFVYSYAAVLENPGHGCEQQPYFQIRILDSVGNPIPSTCGNFTYVSGTPGAFVHVTTAYTHTINWFDWQTVGLDLKPYQGQNISIQFIAADCGASGHFGYAYFYAKCFPRRINIAYCPGSYSAVLTAPDGFAYKWLPGGDTSRSITVTNPIDSSVYKCVLKAIANPTCKDTITTLLLPNIVHSNFTFSNACVNVPVNFTYTSTSNTPIYSWYWDFGSPGSAGNHMNMGTLLSHTYSNPGNYSVTLIDSLTNGCPDTMTKVVTIYPKPVVTAKNDSICPGDSAKLIGIGASTYHWSDGYNGNPHNVSPIVTSPYVVVGTSTFGCKDSAMATVTVFPAPQVSFVADNFSGCSPITVNFTNYTDPPNCVYKWNFGDGVTDTNTNPTHVFHANNSTALPTGFNITLTATTTNGCTSNSISPNLINVYPVPHADFTWTPNIGLIEFPMNFANTSSPSNSSYVYTWDFGDGSSASNDVNPSHAYAVKGTYNVMLISTSDYNCIDTIMYKVDIKNDSLTFPNVITPNNDGVNDYFVIKGLLENSAYPDNKLMVYDRWGKKVYESSNYQNKFNGNGLPDGVYFYVFKAKGILREIEHKGSLEILR